MISNISLLALAAITLAPNSVVADCNPLPVCGKSGMADACKKAVERWESDGIFEVNGAKTLIRSAKSGSLSCAAQMKCDSSGGFHRFIGSDIRSLFNSILGQCSTLCGDSLISGASNCWLQIVGCENCDIPESGTPVGHVSSSAIPKPPASTKQESWDPQQPMTTKKPATSSSVKISSATNPHTTTKSQQPVSSTKKSSAAPPPSTSKKPDPPVTTTRKPDPPATTTKGPGQPSATSKPDPNQEEHDTENAENANDAYQKDPTNKSLAEKLKSEVDKALDSVKKAVEDTADDAVKGAEQSLQKALESAVTKAAAAAAGPTTAAAAAVAAAMEAVKSAKDAVTKAKQNKPTQNPTQKPTSKGPTTTFSASRSSSSTSSSSSSSSSSSCVCLSCGEDQLNLGTASEEKRSSPYNAVRKDSISRRASGRKTNICEDWDVPDYNSWSSSGGNIYNPFYDSSYATNMASCTNVDFDLTTPAGGRARKDYATEHIYEIQMVKQFLTYMWLNDAAILSWRSQPANANRVQCDLWTGFLWHDAAGTSWWDPAFISPSPIEYVLTQLSGGNRAGEMVYLEEKMNSIKGVMFGERSSWSFTLWNIQLAAAAKIGATILYLQNANVQTIYHTVSQRMHNAWKNIDIEAEYEHPDANLKKVQFGDGYLKWEKQFLTRMEDAWKTRPGEEAKGAEDKINGNTKASFAEKTVAKNIKAQRENGNGKFNSANLLFAQGLLSWYTGTRP